MQSASTRAAEDQSQTTVESIDELADEVERQFDEVASARPSQDKLHRDQREAIDEFVDRGVSSRREWLRWLLRFSWLSMGRVDGGWFATAGRDSSVLVCVITDETERRRYRADPPALEDAAVVRRRLAKKYFRPACRAAFREIRRDAQEYVDEEERVDPRDASMFAMRPSLEWTMQRQRLALRQLLDGFATDDALDRWMHRLDDVTLGAIDHVEGDLDWRVEMERGAKRVLLEQSTAATEIRADLASYLVLPACNYAPQLLLDRAQELKEEPDTERLSPTKM
jgi:hypothetical protein